MSQPAISKHVKILEQSGLIQREVDGRVHHLRLSPKAIEAASMWLETQRRFWTAALDRLETFLTEPTEKEQNKK